MSLVRRGCGSLVRAFLSIWPPSWVEYVASEGIIQYARSLQAEDGLRLLFAVDKRLYKAEGKLAIEYGEGLHTKHRHLRYHDFFVERIAASDRVLDVGCGNGALAHDIAERTGAQVYGIDLDERNIRLARASHSHERAVYVVGDALRDLPKGQFTVIILSNVLEHIADRPELLRCLVSLYRPGKVLIRVPCYERDWRIPLQDELGVDYRLDPTHYIEYTQEQFCDEMAQAHLVIDDLIGTWGELWAALHPDGGRT